MQVLFLHFPYMKTPSRKTVVVELDADTVERLNRIARRLEQTRAGLLRIWILAQLRKLEAADG